MRLGQQVKLTLDTDDQGVARGHINTKACNLSTLASSTRQGDTAQVPENRVYKRVHAYAEAA